MLVYVTFGHKCRKTSLNISYNYFRHLVLYIKKYHRDYDYYFLDLFSKDMIWIQFYGVCYLVSLFLVLYLHIFKIDVPNLLINYNYV